MPAPEYFIVGNLVATSFRTDDGWTDRPEKAKRFETIGHARNWALKTLGEGERESWNVFYSTFD